MPAIAFVNQVPAAGRIPRAVIYSTLKKARRVFKARLKDKRVALVFMAAPNVKKLNARYRGKNRPTNVLSFTAGSAGDLGDIIICPTIARAEAKDRGEEFASWVNFLFIHGLLHLLGFDHRNNKEEKLMAKAAAKLT